MKVVEIRKGVIYEDGDGKWRWRTLGGNGEILGWGESYEAKEDALAALMAHVSDDVELEEGTS